MKPDYHDYVIKDGQFIGKFEEMYQACDDPWHSKHEDYDASPCSLATKRLLKTRPSASLLSYGSGTGRHLHWLNHPAVGVEISETARASSRRSYPRFTIFRTEPDGHYDILLFREVLWYILPTWQAICKKYAASLLIVELSFYDDQKYGLDYFNGPDDFVAKWPFTIEQIVREHSTRNQREGRLMIAGRIP